MEPVAEVRAVDQAGVTLAGAVAAGDVLQVLDAQGKELARLRVVSVVGTEARADVTRGSVVRVGDRASPSPLPWLPPGVNGPRPLRVDLALDAGIAVGGEPGATARLDAAVELRPWFYARLSAPFAVRSDPMTGEGYPAVATDLVVAGGFDGGPISGEIQLAWGCAPTHMADPICMIADAPGLAVLVRGGWRDGPRIETAAVFDLAEPGLAGLALSGAIPLATRLDLYGHVQLPTIPPTGGWPTTIGGGAQVWVLGWGGPGAVAVRAGASLLELADPSPVVDLGAAVRW